MQFQELLRKTLTLRRNILKKDYSAAEATKDLKTKAHGAVYRRCGRQYLDKPGTDSGRKVDSRRCAIVPVGLKLKEYHAIAAEG